MLDIFIIAADPIGTWGPGPTVEPLGGWAKLFDDIASDPRAVATITGAVATIIAAFFGFLGGVLIKYELDQRLDRKRRYHESVLRKDEMNALAMAFRAEIGTLLSDARLRLKLVHIKEKSASPGRNFARFDIPAKVMYEGHNHRLGAINKIVADRVFRAHGLADHIRQLVTATQSGMPLTSAHLDGLRDQFLQLIEHTEKAHNALDVFLGELESYPSSTKSSAEASPAGTPAEPAEPVPPRAP